VVSRLGTDTSASLTFPKITAPTAGSFTMTFYYINKNGALRSVYVSVNGASYFSVSLPPTANDAPDFVTVPLDLRTGDNTIRLFHNVDPVPDVDRITLK